jgi:polyisoprenoid-binding protein YceI
MNRLYSVALLTLATMPAHANWNLDGDDSAVSFVSTKAINVAEVHRFGTLSGGVDEAGQVDISISLESVDTGIELRDERMRGMLFDTETYAAATVSATVDADAIDAMSPGESADMVIEGNLDLHGESRPLTMDVVVTRSGDDRLLVVSKKPIVVNAPEFRLGEGVEALREIAGLPSISLAVPVSFVLAFERE